MLLYGLAILFFLILNVIKILILSFIYQKKRNLWAIFPKLEWGIYMLGKVQETVIIWDMGEKS